jgi:hypothetical protein
MHFRSLISLFAVSAMAAGALGQISPSGGGYLFRLKYTPGEVLNYKLTASVPGSTTQGMSMAMKMKVLSVTNGIAHIQATSSSTANGRSFNMPAQDIKIDTLGKSTGGGMAGAAFNCPAKPIKVGDTWSGDLPGMNGKAMGVQTHLTFKAIKVINGRKEALLGIKIQFSGQMQGSGDGTIQLDAADGQIRLLTFDMNITANMPQGQGQPPKPTNIHATTTMTRV